MAFGKRSSFNNRDILAFGKRSNGFDKKVREEMDDWTVVDALHHRHSIVI